MVVLVAEYRAKPGMGDRVEAALWEMIPLARQEPGCRAYKVNRAVDDADQFLLYEIYADEAALKADRRTPHFRRIVEETVVPLLERRERRFSRLVEP